MTNDFQLALSDIDEAVGLLIVDALEEHYGIDTESAYDLLHAYMTMNLTGYKIGQRSSAVVTPIKPDGDNAA